MPSAACVRLLCALLALCVSAVGADLAAFMRWFEANGGSASVEVASYGADNRGVACVGAVAEGSAALRAPMGIVLHAHAAHAVDAHRRISAAFGEDDLSLIGILLLERGDPDSFWRPYLDVLPERVHNALYFTEDEVDAFQSAALASKVRGAQSQLRAAFARFSAKTAGLGLSAATEEDFRWASSIIERYRSMPSPSPLTCT